MLFFSSYIDWNAYIFNLIIKMKSICLGTSQMKKILIENTCFELESDMRFAIMPADVQILPVFAGFTITHVRKGFRLMDFSAFVCNLNLSNFMANLFYQQPCS